MRKNTILIALFLVLLVLLTGCSTMIGSAGAASSTPTIVRLTAVAETTSTPVPAPTASPAPSLTPAAATPSPAAVSLAATVIPSATPSPSSKAVVMATKPAAADSLSGDWDFSFGTMSLTQRDMSLEGTYQWYGGIDSGQIKGVFVSELNQFQGVWISDRSPNSQSLLRWQVAADYSSFSGAAEGGATSQQWCGVRSGQSLPAGCGFSGVWQFRFGSPAAVTGQATLVQTGGAVQGTYVDSQGHSGEIVDGVVTVSSTTEVKLTGIWRNDQGQQDTFEWRLDLTTGRTFQGRRDPGNSEWCGWPTGTNEPAPCGW